MDFRILNAWFHTNCISNPNRDCDNCVVGSIATGLPKLVYYDGEDGGIDCYATLSANETISKQFVPNAE